VRIEIVCDDDLAQRVVDAISSTARTGTIGDGKIWITPASDVIRIRTGEVGAEAI